jgi:type I restriction-modification system DNA methylase subunit
MTGAWVYCDYPIMIASSSLRSDLRIKSALESLTDTRRLKELFCDRLNYHHVSEPISTRRFSDSVRASLGDSEPLLLANGGVGGQFKVIYTRLSSQQIYKQEQRGIIESLLGIHPHSLFVFSNQGQDDWHFINAKHDEKNTQRRLLRRIVVNQREQLRTAIEQIGELDLQSIGRQRGKSLSELEPWYIRDKHDEAFDVEKVTDRFFSEYKLVFESVEGSIEGIENDEQKRLFTQKLFNRLMFIAFVQKKGWLEFNGSGDYFKALWQDYKKAKSQPLGNFYRDRLSHLFFEGLNDPDKQGDKKLIKLIGNVPYLNGGLFEADASEMVPGIVVPDGAIEDILTKLFDRFNFTVSESTPLDVDVAVDPEMLGKVFEELCNNRHGSGSYYTPKPIVAFMCRETLKGYLKSKCEKDVDKIDRFVDDHESGDLADPKAVLEALKIVTACDPACGSGAYLLGMMHELLDLRACLANDDLDVYDRKLAIIENNVYGVDKDVFAVNIARLRLWLSLSVDDDGDKPRRLPNLKYKLEQGDSLITPVMVSQLSLRAGSVQEFQRLKSEYLTAHGKEKKVGLEKAIENIKEQIATFTPGVYKAGDFDWMVDFAEIMADGGFDIQVANPPYVRQEAIVDMKPTLKKVFPQTYNGTSDLYCYFYARSLQLLKPGGMLAFISSNKWFRAGYGEKLRKHIADTCQIDSITDFGDLPVFKSATAYPMIFICSKQSPIDRESVFTQVKSLDFPYPNVREVIKQNGSILPSNAISGGSWLLTNNINAKRFKQMESIGVPLCEYIKGEIYRGVVTGFNEAFFINGDIRNKLIIDDPKSEEIIKPLMVGKDIGKWNLKSKNQYLIFTRRGINIDDYPAIKAYLSQWKTRLEAKPRNWDDNKKWGGRKAGSYKWYEIQDEVNYYSEFDKPKIIFPDIAKYPRFSFEESGEYVEATACMIDSSDFYLLGLLNSKSVYQYFLEVGATIRGGYLRFKRQYVKNIPIPQASEIERKAISKLVQKCLDAKGVGCEQWEREIDEIVAGLYGFASETPPLDAKTLGFGKGIQHEPEVAVLTGKTRKSKQPANTSTTIESDLN